jgi:hypothetical protein
VRWFFVDRVLEYEPWRRIVTRKAISLEEYYLHAPLGREGVFPESLLLECCAESAWWLLAASSSFTQVAEMTDVPLLTLTREATAGTVLTVTLTTDKPFTPSLPFHLCIDVTGDTQPIACGQLICRPAPLTEHSRTSLVRSRWEELYGQT